MAGFEVTLHGRFCTDPWGIRIAYRSANFVALGKVSYTTSDGGMGIAFTQIQPNDQVILEKWVEGLRD